MPPDNSQINNIIDKVFNETINTPVIQKKVDLRKQYYDYFMYFHNTYSIVSLVLCNNETPINDYIGKTHDELRKLFVDTLNDYMDGEIDIENPNVKMVCDGNYYMLKINNGHYGSFIQNYYKGQNIDSWGFTDSVGNTYILFDNHNYKEQTIMYFCINMDNVVSNAIEMNGITLYGINNVVPFFGGYDSGKQAFKLTGPTAIQSLDNIKEFCKTYDDFIDEFNRKNNLGKYEVSKGINESNTFFKYRNIESIAQYVQLNNIFTKKQKFDLAEWFRKSYYYVDNDYLLFRNPLTPWEYKSGYKFKNLVKSLESYIFTIGKGNNDSDEKSKDEVCNLGKILFYNKTPISEIGLYNPHEVPIFPRIGDTKLNLLTMRWEQYNHPNDPKNGIIPFDKIDPDIKKRLHDHFFKVCANNNQEYFNYIIKYHCNILFRPWEKDGILLIYYSPNNGDGKSAATKLIEPLMGPNLFVESDDKRVIGQRFNTLLLYKILLTLDDMGKQGPLDMAEIKRTLTLTSRVIESKGQNVYVVGDLTHFIGSTNVLDCVRISDTDRRIAIFRVSSEFIQNSDYFDPLMDMLKRTDYIQQAISWFYYYDHQPEIQAVNTKKIPLTEPRAALMGNYENNIKQFLSAIVKKEYILDWDIKNIDEVHYSDNQTLYSYYIDCVTTLFKQKDCYSIKNFIPYIVEMFGVPKDKRETITNSYVYHYGQNKKPKAYSITIRDLAKKLKLEEYLIEWEAKKETKEDIEKKIKEMESYIQEQKLKIQQMKQ